MFWKKRLSKLFCTLVSISLLKNLCQGLGKCHEVLSKWKDLKKKKKKLSWSRLAVLLTWTVCLFCQAHDPGLIKPSPHHSGRSFSAVLSLPISLKKLAQGERETPETLLHYTCLWCSYLMPEVESRSSHQSPHSLTPICLPSPYKYWFHPNILNDGMLC